MKFSDFIRNGQVRRTSIDSSLAKSLIDSADNDLAFLNSLEVTVASARKIMSNYYDVLRSLLEAIAVLDGYKIYSHEAFAYFLKEKNDLLAAEKFDRFRKIRNRINYYGKDISSEEVRSNSAEILRLIETLKIKYLGKPHTNASI